MYKIQTLILIWLFVYFPFNSHSQIPKIKSVNKIFFVGRSTNFKAGIIAKEFNICDTTLTHVGIGIYSNDTLKVYNVSDTEKDKFGSNLLCQSIEDFTKTTDIANLKIFELTVSKKIYYWTKAHRLKNYSLFNS